MKMKVIRDNLTKRVVSLSFTPNGATDEIFLSWLANAMEHNRPIDMGDGSVFESGGADETPRKTDETE